MIIVTIIKFLFIEFIQLSL